MLYRRRTMAAGPAYEDGVAGPGRATVAAGNTALFIARLVSIAASVVALIIVAGILLYVLGAHQSNDVVRWVHDAAKTLVGPFDHMFTVGGAKATLAVNWGIAAVVYLVIGSLIARLIAGLAPGEYVD